MPLYKLQCLSGHESEEFCHVPEDKGCRTVICDCGETMTYVPAYGQGLCYFEEGRIRRIENMGHDPVYVTSHEHHKRLLRERQLEIGPAGRGMPGQWS
jgi:hypothetical protein